MWGARWRHIGDSVPFSPFSVIAACIVLRWSEALSEVFREDADVGFIGFLRAVTPH